MEQKSEAVRKGKLRDLTECTKKGETKKEEK